MGMASAQPMKELAIVSQAIRGSHARIFVLTCVVDRASAPVEGACALQASLVWIVQSRHAVVAMAIVLSPEHAFAIQDGSVTNVRWQWNVLIHHAVDMALARMANVHAKLGFLG